MSNKKLSVCIIGASGYTGVECYRLLLQHPNIKSISLVANSNVGMQLSALYSSFDGSRHDANLLSIEAIDFKTTDVVFCCLPHAQSQKIILDLYKNYEHLKIIDLSADFRLNDTKVYESIYGTKHLSPSLQASDVAYGLSELVSKDELKQKRIIACPGCYPTSIIIPLKPLLQEGLIDSQGIIADSKSGISGAGRKDAVQFLFTERSDNIKAYSIFNHRHTPEINEKLGVNIVFTPHLVPIIRGIESTIYARLTTLGCKTNIHNFLTDFYKGHQFVKTSLKPPSTADVKGTNNIKIHAEQQGQMLVMSSVIDNICKGSSGQAVQNMNLAFGFDETTGLSHLSALPV